MARAHCANWQHDGSCAGIHHDNTGRVTKVERKEHCTLRPEHFESCPYFEECVCPMRDFLTREAKKQFLSGVGNYRWRARRSVGSLTRKKQDFGPLGRKDLQR